MVGEAVTDVTTGLLATDITVGMGVTTTKVRSYLCRDLVSVDLWKVATEFSKAPEESIEAANECCDTKEFAEFTDNWQANAEVLAAMPAAPVVEAREYSKRSLHLFEELGTVRSELKTRRNLVTPEIEENASERAGNRYEAERGRLDELDRNLSDEREQFEHVCTDIPEV